MDSPPARRKAEAMWPPDRVPVSVPQSMCTMEKCKRADLWGYGLRLLPGLPFGLMLFHVQPDVGNLQKRKGTKWEINSKHLNSLLLGTRMVNLVPLEPEDFHVWVFSSFDKPHRVCCRFL